MADFAHFGENIISSPAHLGSEEDNLKEILGILKRIYGEVSDNKSALNGNGTSNNASKYSKRTRRYNGGFMDAIEDSVTGPYKKQMQDAINQITEGLNLSDYRDIPYQIGKNISDAFDSGSFNLKDIFKPAAQASEGAANTFNSAAQSIDASGTLMGNSMESAATSTASVSAGFKGLVSSGGEYLATLHLFTAFTEGASVALEGFGNMLAEAGKSVNRDSDTMTQEAKNATKRLLADVETLVRRPFQILEEAAKELYAAWDNNIRVINQTQGYTKDNLQSLMSTYGVRLEAEGLSKVISGADVISSLKSILESGLSGQIAEEFAIEATKLQAAIPTQNFFGLAGSYGQLASQAMMRGMSMPEAIAYATAQLEIFASNVLYAGRQISGGFSTGLTNATDIFEKAVNIASTAGLDKTNLGALTGVLAAISSITGAIAPDLASGLLESVYSAATGGNVTNLVALRSLAGVNASNTEFLNALVQNPQQTLYTLFSNLASMQTMEPQAYMEVAEGLSNIFGLSTSDISRIDFALVAKAIRDMSVSSASLDENMALLQSGQSTTTDAILKTQQINEYMIKEGLMYVLDSEASRAIQEHMWDEQLNAELMENTYGVELVGSTREFFVSIKSAFSKLLSVLTLGSISLDNNGLSIGNKVIQSYLEGHNWEKDIESSLRATAVGSQTNSEAWYYLTERNTTGRQYARNIKSYLSMLGAYSNVDQYRRDRDTVNSYIIGTAVAASGLGLLAQGLWSASGGPGMMTLSDFADIYKHAGPRTFDASGLNRAYSSSYGWGSSITKSQMRAANGFGKYAGYTPRQISELLTQTSTSQSALQTNFQQMLGAIESYVSRGQTYSDWVNAAGSFGISNYGETISNLGYSENDIKEYYSQFEAKKATEEAKQEHEADTIVREAIQRFLGTSESVTFENYQSSLYDKLDIISLVLGTSQDNSDAGSLGTSIMGRMSSIWSQEVLNGGYLNDINGNISSLKNFFIGDYLAGTKGYEKRLDTITGSKNDNLLTSVNQLATALLASNDTAGELKSPVVQMNTILAAILVAVEAIRNQNSTTPPNISLSEALSGLATGQLNFSFG